MSVQASTEEHPTLSPEPRSSSLTQVERGGLWLLFVVFVVFGGVVELRSAFLRRRMGDLEVFLRTAWAVRAGVDIYQVTDHNGFHYHYPPLLAIVLTPLADPPSGYDRSWTLPYAVTVALWYALSVVCLAVAVHSLASALEETTLDQRAPRPPPSSRCWWALRIVPVLVCLPAIGHTLMRGQVGLLLLLLLSGMLRCLIRRQSTRAGIWLAGAICLKVIPAFLLLVPFYRRDIRCLAGCTLGLFVGLLAIPAAVFGPERTLAYYREWTDVLLRPGLGTGADQSRARELIDITATDSQSFQAILHNTIHRDPGTRPPQPASWVRGVHWMTGALLTLLTLAAGWRRTANDGVALVLFVSALVIIMLILSPVCHLHYFCLAVPLVMGLMAASWRSQHTRSSAIVLAAGFIVHTVATTLPHFPLFQRMRDVGLATYGTLLLWWIAIVFLRFADRRPGCATAGSGEMSRLAA
jgi:alpha-1,2-mannosyltransferase